VDVLGNRRFCLRKLKTKGKACLKWIRRSNGLNGFIITLKDCKTGKIREINHTDNTVHKSEEDMLKFIELMWSDGERFEIVSIKKRPNPG